MAENTFVVRGFTTQAGVTLDVRLSYTTHGTLSATADNAIVVLTSYAAQHDEAEGLFAPSATLDLANYFIVVIDMVCNGASSSPSNTPAPIDGPRFPHFTVHDNVACQRRLIDALSIARVRLVMGFSMGGLQTFEWGCQHGDIVDALLPICGAARVAPHNYLFLDGAKGALTLDPAFHAGDYAKHGAQPDAGKLAFARVYAGWAFSQTFFREALYQNLGLNSVSEVVDFMFTYFARRDANDLLGMLWTWQHADISANDRFGGDFPAALRSITARCIVMPGATDLYFTRADSELEVAVLPNAELRPIDSPMGHVAGSGTDPIGKAAIDQAIVDLLR